MWPGVEPQKDQYNETYINILETIVDRGSEYGIFTLLDFHQDLFSEKFCADGIPMWAVQMPSFSLLSFPRPVDLHAYDYDEKTGLPIGCGKHAWANYYFSWAVSSNFQYLYDNTYGLLDKLGKFWEKIAIKFKNNTNVIGYELINEPWAGNVIKNPLLLIPGVADKENLERVYDYLNNEYIRKIDEEHLIFFEPVTWDNFISVGFSHPPGGEKYQNRSVLSHHFYKPPDLGVDMHFYHRQKDIKRLKIAGMLTEFWGSDDELLVTGNQTMDACDTYPQSWIGWAYQSEGAYYANGSVRHDKIKKLARTYAQAVAGKTISMKFVENTAEYILKYEVCKNCGETEIYASEFYYYPNGVKIEVEPESSVVYKKGKRNKHLFLGNTNVNEGQIVTIRMTPL